MGDGLGRIIEIMTDAQLSQDRIAAFRHYLVEKSADTARDIARMKLDGFSLSFYIVRKLSFYISENDFKAWIERARDLKMTTFLEIINGVEPKSGEDLDKLERELTQLGQMAGLNLKFFRNFKIGTFYFRLD